MKMDTAANATADVFRCSIIANTHQLHAAKAKSWEWLQSTSPLTIAAFGASGRQVAPGCDSRLSCRVTTLINYSAKITFSVWHRNGPHYPVKTNTTTKALTPINTYIKPRPMTQPRRIL